MKPMLKDFLTAIHPIDYELLVHYINHWKPCSFPKKTILTAEGSIQKDMYFVISGIQKSYYLHKGKEHVIAFTYPPSFSGIPESFITQTPSKYFLETITASQCLKLSHNQHQTLLAEHRALETLFRKGIERLLFGVIQRHCELMAFDIRTRFKAFLKRSPHLLNQIPHKDLAAYLRIDASNFSKLLNNVKILV